MRTQLCDDLGIEFPIFAFTHCRDVVAAVCNAGGMGVLGAVGFTPEQLEQELIWLDEHVNEGLTYGVDIVIPQKYEGMEDMSGDDVEQMLKDMVPQEAHDFAAKLLADHNVPELPAGEESIEVLGFGAAMANPLIDVTLDHPRVSMIANALGTPPPEIVDRVQDAGLLIGALCGSVAHAISHKEAGLDFVVCQGGEGGGHTGDVGSVVLWPEVLDVIGDLPLLAAGGIGGGRQMAAALAMGAQGVWTGSLWLTVEEADIPPAQMDIYLKASSRDTVRSRSWTGKPCRMLRTDWSDAWDSPDTPAPLGMPLQTIVSVDAIVRGHRYPEAAVDVNFYPCGQIIGRLDKMKRSRDVIFEMVEEFIESVERLNTLLAE